MSEPAHAVVDAGHDGGCTAIAQALFERHHARIHRHCAALLRSRQEAEDALQQTFVNAVLALRAGVRPTFELAWLLAIARNVCLERQRSTSRRARIETATPPESIEGIAAVRADGDGGFAELRAAIAELEPRQREALVLREWRGLTYREIADEMELSHAHVETLLFRARRSLAQALDGGKKLRGALSLPSLSAYLRGLLGGSPGTTAAAVVGGCATIVAGAGLEHAITRHGHASPPARVAPAPSHGAAARQSRSRAPAGISRRRTAAATPAPPAPAGGGTGGGGAAGPTARSPVSTAPPAPAPMPVPVAVPTPVTATVPAAAPAPTQETTPRAAAAAPAVTIETPPVSVDVSVGASGAGADVSVAVPGGTSADASVAVGETGATASVEAATPVGIASAGGSVGDSGATVTATAPVVGTATVSLPLPLQPHR